MRCKRIYQIVFGSVAALVLACDETFDLYQLEPVPVINCFFNPEDTLRVNLSESFSTFQNIPVTFGQGANIQLYRDEEPIGSFREDELSETWYDHNGFYSFPTLPLENGEVYSIKGEYNGSFFHAVDSVPFPVEIKEIKTSKRVIDSSQNIYEFLISMTFDDPAGRNFYALRVIQILSCRTREYQSIRPIVISNSPAIEADISGLMDPQLIFSDRLFDNETYKIDFSFEQIEQPSCSQIYEVQLLSISQAYYEYATSYYKQVFADQDFYSEPSTVFSNIDGGKGIFAAYAKATSRFIHSCDSCPVPNTE